MFNESEAVRKGRQDPRDRRVPRVIPVRRERREQPVPSDRKDSQDRRARRAYLGQPVPQARPALKARKVYRVRKDQEELIGRAPGMRERIM